MEFDTEDQVLFESVITLFKNTGCLIETEQKYWLITWAGINFRGQTICHFFTDTRTFWYLV